ncbi:hypothetical protein JR316_0009431 [Psilocybe cubensis]|uniref:Uncharacterized protein n=2 Tax=Psilocybe cubensis TaxID=181762 RepID=A0ACB8GTA1_PSICU|nr:hypothetical protein JR316_0009431 [Psilocybe cubensis]KAH9478968.1 hypothetical protein JR316_0009431 [Psilocybe cubensis]
MDPPPPSPSSSREPPMGGSRDQPPANDPTSLPDSSQPSTLSSTNSSVSQQAPAPASSAQQAPPAPSVVPTAPTHMDSATSVSAASQTSMPATTDLSALPFYGVNFSSSRVPRPMELVSPAMILLVITVGYIVGIFDREDQVDMNILFLVPGYAVRQFFSWAEAIAYYTERFNAGDVRIVQPVRPPVPTVSSLAPAPSSSAAIPPSSDPPRRTAPTASAAHSATSASNKAPESLASTRPACSNASRSLESSRSAVASSSAKVLDPTARFGTEPNPIPIGFGSPLTARAIRLSRQYVSPTRSSTSRIRARGSLGSPVRPSKRLRIIKSRKHTTEGKAPSWDDSDDEAPVIKSRQNKGKAPVRNNDNDVFGTGAPPSYSAAVASSSSNPPPLQSDAPSTSSAPSDAPVSATPSSPSAAPTSSGWGQVPSRPATPYPPYSEDDFYSGRWSFTREDQALFDRLGEVIRHQWATAATPADWPTLSDEAHERRRNLLRAIGQHMVALYPRRPEASSSSSTGANGHGTENTGAGSSSQSQPADTESSVIMDTSGDGKVLGNGLDRSGEPGSGTQ